MKFHTVENGEVFFFKNIKKNIPMLRTEQGFADLLYRTEETNISAFDDEEVSIISLEMLCVFMHLEEVKDWVNGARSFYASLHDSTKN